MKKSEVTAIILAKNEASSIRECIHSLQWCEHVIVGDDTSVDKTIQIAKASQADIIKVPADFVGFDQKRNYLASYAPTDWILWVDADEILSASLQKEIENGEWRMENKSAFTLKRMDIFLGKKLQYGETSRTWLIRLVNKNQGSWKRAVHEVWETTGEVGVLSGELLHYSHPDLEEFFEKINRYTELEAESRMKYQESSTSPYFILHTLYFLQLFLYPIAKFIQNYLLRGGWRDGFPGFTMAYMMSLHSLCVRIKVLEKARHV